METLPWHTLPRDRLLRDGGWVVAFLADGCPSCRRFRPRFESWDGGDSFRSAVGDVTYEESPLSDDLGIEVVPTIIVFRDGRPLLRRESDPEIGLPPDASDRADASAIALPMRSSRRSAST